MSDREIAARLWAIVLRRFSPQQVQALERIARTHPTPSELAAYLEISHAQAANLTTSLHREGLVVREKAGRSYRYKPAFPAPLPFHYFDRSPIQLDGPAAARAAEILERRGAK